MPDALGCGGDFGDGEIPSFIGHGDKKKDAPLSLEEEEIESCRESMTISRGWACLPIVFGILVIMLVVAGVLIIVL